MMGTLVAAIVALIAGVAVGYGVRRVIVSDRARTAELRAAKIVADAELQAETKVRHSLIEVKEEIAAMRREAEEDLRVRREETRQAEGRLTRMQEAVEGRAAELRKREEELERMGTQLTKLRSQLEQAGDEHRQELERVSRMTAQEAKEALAQQVVHEAKRDAMASVREIEQRAREEGEDRARKIVTIAIQRVASEQTAESTVSVFPLPSEDMKGRIIGREGRNIRTFEAVTGVNLIIDDTPEAVVLSCFDPVRRETARITLEKLVGDGRIHPARIEEMYQRAMGEVEEQVKRAGESALVDVGITDVHPEMIRLLGRLQYRTSYGQNVLRHLVESAHIGAAIAAELGVNPRVVKR